ncbi:hypothetical protein KM918_25100 [Priestia megaterium]|uniref:hypothetical protein n=1 Tax=Priestia megaterium TaxID=1404 RepID=UPI001C2147AF|nr:hypothetical protein [Priestia megaterium]MBU8690578.1 hypothetical protein [Priestia megaterium]
MKKTAKNTEVVETFTSSTGVVVRVREKHLDTGILARFLIGLPQVADATVDNKTEKKTA